jgi:hypothetical protein
VRRNSAEQGDLIARFASGEEILRPGVAEPMAGTTGDIEAISLWAGQSVALASQPQLAAAIVAELVSRFQPKQACTVDARHSHTVDSLCIRLTHEPPDLGSSEWMVQVWGLPMVPTLY